MATLMAALRQTTLSDFLPASSERAVSADLPEDVVHVILSSCDWGGFHIELQLAVFLKMRRLNKYFAHKYKWVSILLHKSANLEDLAGNVLKTVCHIMATSETRAPRLTITQHSIMHTMIFRACAKKSLLGTRQEIYERLCDEFTPTALTLDPAKREFFRNTTIRLFRQLEREVPRPRSLADVLPLPLSQPEAQR